ncbi:MAG: ArsR family transcriptional regulator [Anaerolinea sp.]|nr:ArsR family transcriptional regulator [Anaerolinea sp.]
MISEKSEKIISRFEKQAHFFKLLTHPARLAILEILRDGEHCVCHMEAYLGYKQAYISQQLSVLREAGLIKDRRDGWNIFYRVADANIFEVLDAFLKVDGQSQPNLEKGNVVCNCPHCSIKENLD